MGRPKGSKNKPKVNLSEEDKTALESGQTTPEVIAEKYQVEPSVISNLRKSSKLKTEFTLVDSNQVSASGGETQQGIIENKTNLQNSQISQKTEIINYDDLVRAFWSGIDGTCSLFAFMLRGKLEYTPLTKQDLDRLVEGTKGDKFVQKVASFNALGSLVTIGTIFVVFKDRLKLKKVDHKEGDPTCKCDKCKKQIKENEKQSKEPQPEPEPPQQSIPQEPVIEESLNITDNSLTSEMEETNFDGGFITQKNDFMNREVKPDE